MDLYIPNTDKLKGETRPLQKLSQSLRKLQVSTRDISHHERGQPASQIHSGVEMNEMSAGSIHRSGPACRPTSREVPLQAPSAEPALPGVKPPMPEF